MSFADKLENAAEQGKGKVKEAAGQATGDEQLEQEGQLDQVKAHVKDAADSVVSHVKDAVDKAKDALS